MKRKLFIGVLLVIIGFLLGYLYYYRAYKTARRANLSPPGPMVSGKVADADRAFTEIVRSVSPSVVNIATTKLKGRVSPLMEDPFFDLFGDFFDQYHDFEFEGKGMEQNLGSGLIISEDGYIITNNHVVSNADKIKVTLFDKRVFDARIVGLDPKTDIAVVKISARDLSVIPWGDSDRLRVGEFVLAIGNPFGLDHTVTMGIISAVGRANVGIADYEDFIQTDAAINPGNSGGPLVDAEGNVIGINTAIFSKSGGYQGIGFAVPSNMAGRITEQLRSEGKVVRGWLGVNMQDLTLELAREFGLDKAEGALIGEVFSGSPAEKSGLRRGDVIVEFGGKEASGPASLKNLVATGKPGAKVPVKIVRKRTPMMITVTIGELPAETEKPARPSGPSPELNPFSGLNVVTLTEEISRQLDLEGEISGVVAVSVKGGSPAEEAGLRRGDVILEVENRKIRGESDFYSVASALASEDSILLYVNRGGRKFYMTLSSL